MKTAKFVLVSQRRWLIVGFGLVGSTEGLRASLLIHATDFDYTSLHLSLATGLQHKGKPKDETRMTKFSGRHKLLCGNRVPFSSTMKK